MKTRFPISRCAIVEAAMAILLTACGGGGGDDTLGKLPGISTVTVVGDSLSDSGTYFNGPPGAARLFSVQGSSAEPYVLWVERVAHAFKLAPLCPVYKLGDGDLVVNRQPGCTNYAVAGSRINNAANPTTTSAAHSILLQLRDAGAAGWSPAQLLLIHGGANDAADLLMAYLDANTDLGAAYKSILATLLPAAALTAIDAGPDELDRAGALYMQALADQLAAGIRADALDKGMRHVLIANMPTITLTPRFESTLDQWASKRGAAERARAEALFVSWITSFNQRLASQFASETRVRVADVAARFTQIVARPQDWNVANTTLPVCGAQGLAVVPWRSLTECTAKALATTPPPPGAPPGADWWERYLFADNFHPTPFGHQLMANLALEELARPGWR